MAQLVEVLSYLLHCCSDCKEPILRTCNWCIFKSFLITYFLKTAPIGVAVADTDAQCGFLSLAISACRFNPLRRFKRRARVKAPADVVNSAAACSFISPKKWGLSCSYINTATAYLVRTAEIAIIASLCLSRCQGF